MMQMCKVITAQTDRVCIAAGAGAIIDKVDLQYDELSLPLEDELLGAAACAPTAMKFSKTLRSFGGT